MALLNPPSQVPSIARLIYRYLLRVAKGQKEDVENLRSRLAPETLKDSDKRSSSPFEDTLSTCVSLQLLESTDGQVRLHPGLPKEARDHVTGEASFARTMRQLILSRDQNEGLWKSTAGARDLTRALCWYLMQEVYEAPGRWEKGQGVPDIQSAQRRDLARDNYPFSNDTRWAAFVRWAPFLGFAWAHGIQDGNQRRAVLVPDPTPAVRDVLRLISDRDKLWEARQLVGELAKALPVLDHGVYSREFLQRSKQKPAAEWTLSASLSHALRRLEAEGILELRPGADVETISLVRSDGQAPDSYPHVFVRA